MSKPETTEQSRLEQFLELEREHQAGIEAVYARSEEARNEILAASDRIIANILLYNNGVRPSLIIPIHNGRRPRQD